MAKIKLTEEEELEAQIKEMLEIATPGGKKVIERILDMSEREPGFYRVLTPNGFHVCLGIDHDDIKLVQVWADREHKMKQVIETRMQDLPNYIDFNKIEKNNITTIFQKAQFLPTSGEYNNMALNFSKDVKSGSESEFLDGIDNAIVQLANIIRMKASQI